MDKPEPDFCALINDGTPCPDNIEECCEICYKWDDWQEDNG